MDKTAEQAQMLKNRVAKNHKALRKWARKNSVTCFRLYDRDIPEIPLAIDLYEFLPDDVSTPEEAQDFINSQAAAESA
ncbi:MAG: rRNA (guanine-N2)-methyltransferase, partial [Treponema sp.]|nr:rRNA (guanine-N2)-methyltransferase [Treponema sp.]